MRRYIKRGHVWLLVDHRYVVVINLCSGIYDVELYSTVDGTRIIKAWARSLDAAKDRGRVELYQLDPTAGL